MNDDLWSRQRRLPEIGEHGQALIAAESYEVFGSDGAILESEYLHRAGAQRVAIMPRAEPVPFAHEGFFRFAASRRVGAGAWRALAALRRTLGLEAP